MVSYGGGANSTALLIGLHQHRIPVDLILFADTGAEHPHTYAYLEVMDRWLKDHGMPPITRVYKTTRDGKRLTLEDECLQSCSLPSIAYGFKRCSLKHKIGPQDTFDCGGHTFTAKGKQVLSQGWRAIQEVFRSSLKEKPEDEDSEDVLPALTEGQAFETVSVSITEHFTSPPKPYTEDTLLSAMENAGKEDMSRFGRDYLQVGMYTEIMFPEHDIHFIAVNDGVDSTQGDNEFTPFRNIINEWYAKDTSKKIRAVMKVKGNAGEHLATLPPYGYMKSSDDKKQWVKDEEAAQVVYEIGLYIMDGLGPSQIARKLTERKILTPAAYYASKGRTTNVTKKGSPYAWDSSTIADIMDRWREYLGHTVNFKTRKKSYKSKKTLLNPESEWKIFENTHEAIWTEAIADAARLARQTRRRPTKMGEMGMFSGMMFCADCGSIMYQCRATNFRRDQEYYLCSGYRKSRDVCGQTHSIRTVILEELVLQNLREIVSFASQRKDDFVKMVMDADMRQRNRGLAKRKKTLADAEKRIAELDTIFKRLYEDTISGKLSDERFQKLSTDYEKEQHQLQEVAATLRGEIEAEEQKSANVERFLSVVERYTEIPELTPCILHEFIEKIVVHAASDPKGKNRTQEIDIYYKGIGALEISKVTSSRQE